MMQRVFLIASVQVSLSELVPVGQKGCTRCKMEFFVWVAGVCLGHTLTFNADETRL